MLMYIISSIDEQKVKSSLDSLNSQAALEALTSCRFRLRTLSPVQPLAG